MRKLFTLMALLAILTVQGAGLGKHLSIILRQENIPVEEAPQYFSKWVKTGSKTTFTLMKDETDELGYRHQHYGQRFDGVTVDAARLIVHSKDGKLTHANGYVMETGAAPVRRMPKPAGGVLQSPTGNDVVLVETPTAHHKGSVHT